MEIFLLVVGVLLFIAAVLDSLHVRGRLRRLEQDAKYEAERLSNFHDKWSDEKWLVRHALEALGLERTEPQQSKWVKKAGCEKSAPNRATE